MNLHRLPLALLGASALALASNLSAQVVAKTVPQGVITFTIAAGTPSVPKLTTLSLPLRDSVPSNFVGAPAGKITGFTGNSITSNGAGWPVAFVTASNPYFVRIMTGALAGRTLQVTANTADTLTVNNQGVALAGIVTNTDTFELFPADTLQSLFSTVALAGTAQTGDLIQLHNGALWLNYYFDGTSFRDAIFNIAANPVVRPDQPLSYFRRGPQVAFTLLGTVPSVPAQIVIKNGGVTPIANPYPVSRTISTLGIQASPNWTNGTTDKAAIFNGALWINYIFDGTNWRDAIFNIIQNNAVVPVGGAVVINQGGSASGSSVTTAPLPYTL